MATNDTHVVVIGAGFAGLTAARRLVRGGAGSPGRLRVTIVDRHNHHTFQPLLYQVATASLHPQDIGHEIRSVFRHRGHGRVRFRMGKVVEVDPRARRIRLADGDTIGYDHLVVAAGATTADYGIDGVAEHAFPLKSIEQSVALRNHLLRQFELAEADPALLDRGVLTFVVAGAGPTGVELAGALAELVDGPLRRDHPDLDLSRVRIVLVEMCDAVLPPYQEASQRYTHRQLEQRGVEVRLGTAIEQVREDRAVLSSGEVVPAATVVWTAGVEPSPLTRAMGVRLTPGGRVDVADDLSVPGHPQLWVAGDMAGARDPDGEPYPQLAPVAMQQGRHVADQLRRRIAGLPTRPFRYRDKGMMATIGRKAAVAELPLRVRLRGLPAWLAWLFLHLLELVGFRNRLAVFISWLWNYLTHDRSARLILDSGRQDGEHVPPSRWTTRDHEAA